ncbi:MAG: phosphotransacetylase family protein [Thermosynechococcaceae cyanobacterium MS004]|nr:phosphotransacetylase family protein [Thermosynechococcaceae cyanobacterium MS004]
MPYPTKHLLIGSPEAYSGKSAAVLGLIPQILERGLRVAYGKPLSINFSGGSDELPGGDPDVDLDVQFIVSALNLKEQQVVPSTLTLTEADVQQRLRLGPSLPQAPVLPAIAQADLVVLEGPSTLAEGTLFGFSLLQQAEQMDAAILLVARCQTLAVVDELLAAKAQLGDRLAGVVLNDVPKAFSPAVDQFVTPFLEQNGIAVFGQIPSHPLLRSISVREIVQKLGAEVLCCGDRLNLMVEQLTIGAMNVNSALRYFNRASNMAVVTGGDRTDIQLAALEASTNCLILTGHFLPNSIVINRAEDLEVPVLSVDLDTLTTVELIDKAFSQARFSETIKVDCILQLFKQNVDLERLLAQLEIKPPVRA